MIATRILDADALEKKLFQSTHPLRGATGRYQARDKLVDELENEIYKLKCSKSV